MSKQWWASGEKITESKVMLNHGQTILAKLLFVNYTCEKLKKFSFNVLRALIGYMNFQVYFQKVLIKLNNYKSY